MRSQPPFGYVRPAPPVDLGEVFFTATYFECLNEVNYPATVSVRRTGTDAVGVHWATVDGTAVAPGDYQTASGDLVWAEDDVADKTFIVNGVLTANKYFVVTLSAPVNCTLGTPASVNVDLYPPV